MPIIGDIKNLYSDREKTRALFPTTKIEAVSDEEGTGLNVILDSMVHIGELSAETSTVPINADTVGGIPAEDMASKAFVSNKIAEAQLDGSGDIDLSGYATKDELATIDFPVDSVNGKTGAVTLSASDVGARPSTWTPTAADVGAAASSHNHAASNITSGTLSSDRLPTVPLTKGGLGGTDRLASAKNLTNEAVSSPGYVVSLTSSWKNFGYTTLQQLRNASGLGNTTGALPIANGGTGSTGATTASANNSYYNAYFSKFGNLVICSILPKAADGVQYDVSITIPSGYVPKSNKTFQFYSWTNKNAGGTGMVQITANAGGFLAFQQAYGFSIHDIKYTLSWTV